MRYGESLFDIFYLLFAIISGCKIYKRADSKAGKLMGLAVLLLGCGDAFHLVPRVLNYFVDADFTAALGIGKLITSITMTIFYVFMYYIWDDRYGSAKTKNLKLCVLLLAALRIVLCLFPQNGWSSNESDMTWGIIRNVPFVLLGALIIALFYQKRADGRPWHPGWIYILLSFLFYIPVAVGAGAVPMLGMLMLPKTICYILLIVIFLKITNASDSKKVEGK